jgi:hypothetical protein
MANMSLVTPAPMFVAESNSHISIPEIQTSLAPQLAAIESANKTTVGLEVLSAAAGGADTTTKFIVRTKKGHPLAVVVCSRPTAPDMVLRGVMRAEQVRQLVGPMLGQAIIQPWTSGYAESRSYVILPWYRGPSTSKVGRLWYCQRLKGPVLNWLRAATAMAAAENIEPTEGETFVQMLEYLGAQSFLTKNDRSDLKQAIGRLQSGAWKPRHTFDHNDFWYGNILLRRGGLLLRSNPLPFVLIDWVGANAAGFGIYDLVRCAQSFGVTPKRLGRELQRHAEALHCQVQDTEGHLFAALGRLHRHIEAFPEEQFRSLYAECRFIFKNAMATVEPTTRSAVVQENQRRPVHV